jgi:phosphocarrier protein FPr
LVGLVIVAHSAKLAEGVAELARAMGGEELLIRTAGGLDLPNSPLGTDPMMVLAAIDQVYSDDGVIVLMDLGSAVLSAEMALDLMPAERRAGVVLCEAPLVEGAVAAAAQARLGSSLEQVVSEARRALEAKTGHLGQSLSSSQNSNLFSGRDGSGGGVGAQGEIRLQVQNRVGLHARPAALFVQTLQPFKLSKVLISNLTTGGGPVNARSLTSVLALNVRKGNEILIAASGPDAGAALDALRELAAANFGDKEEASP